VSSTRLGYRVACQDASRYHAGRSVTHVRLTARGRAARDWAAALGFLTTAVAGLSLAAHLAGGPW